VQINQVKAIITGGASGLGRATAQYLVERGAQVALLDIQGDAGDQAVAEIGNGATFYQTDVVDEHSVKSSIEFAAAAMNGMNCTINCAGIIGAGRVLGRDAPMPLDHFARTIHINLIGSFNVAKASADMMQHNTADEDGQRGVIINTASVAAYEGQIGQAAYAASKGGIVSMTLPMAREFTRFGIRVMTLAPGVFHTPMIDNLPPQVQEALAATVPFPSRLGKPDEFANAVKFVIENSYLNGSVIRLDGAIRLEPK